MRKAVNLKPETDDLLKSARIVFLNKFKDEKATDDKIIRAALFYFSKGGQIRW